MKRQDKILENVDMIDLINLFRKLEGTAKHISFIILAENLHGLAAILLVSKYLVKDLI